MIEPDVDRDELLHTMLDAHSAGHEEAFEQVIALLRRMELSERNRHFSLWRKFLSGGER